MLSVFNVCMLCTSMVPYVCSSVAMITCLASSPGLFSNGEFLSCVQNMKHVIKGLGARLPSSPIPGSTGS